MADMKITIEGIDSKKFFSRAKTTIYNDNEWVGDEECLAIYDSFVDMVSVEDNTVVIHIDYDSYEVGVIYDTLYYLEFSRAVIESSDFKTIVFDTKRHFLELLCDFSFEYKNVSNEYDHAFICEYLEQNKRLPERDLYVVSLGETNREAQLENFGVYLWEHYLDGYSKIEDMAELGELSDYIKIDYFALGNDFISEWEETDTYAYRSL